MNYPTWSDLNNPSIVPPLGARSAPDIGPVAVMVSCDPDLRFLKSRNAVSKTIPFFISTLMEFSEPHGGISMAGPFIGAPYAAMLLDSLIAKGANQVVVLGWCGALDDTLAVGDIIVPSEAIVDEGTSRNYKKLEETFPVSRPDRSLTDKLWGYLKSEDIQAEKEVIWTTDAIYRETQKKVAYFNGMGARAVEMECSALFSVAEYRKIKLAAALVVSDSVASRDWEPGFRKKRFKQARQKACKSVVDFAKIISEHE